MKSPLPDIIYVADLDRFTHRYTLINLEGETLAKDVAGIRTNLQLYRLGTSLDHLDQNEVWEFFQWYTDHHRYDQASPDARVMVGIARRFILHNRPSGVVDQIDLKTVRRSLIESNYIYADPEISKRDFSHLFNQYVYVSKQGESYLRERVMHDVPDWVGSYSLKTLHHKRIGYDVSPAALDNWSIQVRYNHVKTDPMIPFERSYIVKNPDFWPTLIMLDLTQEGMIDFIPGFD